MEHAPGGDAQTRAAGFYTRRGRPGESARSQCHIAPDRQVIGGPPGQRRLHHALAGDDLFTVAVDLFPTDTTDFADIVLPAASFLEFDDVHVGASQDLHQGVFGIGLRGTSEEVSAQSPAAFQQQVGALCR